MSASAFEKHFLALNQKAVHFQIKIGNYPTFFHLSPALDLLNKDLLSKKAEYSSLLSEISSEELAMWIEKNAMADLQASLELDGVSLTPEDVFQEYHVLSDSGIPALTSLSNLYLYLRSSGDFPMASFQNVRDLYDLLTKGSLAKNERPDGFYFRNRALEDPAFPVDENGIKYVMKEDLNLLRMDGLSPFVKSVLWIFFGNDAQPFYAGNGRFFRYVATAAFNQWTSSSGGYFIARAYQSQEKDIEKAFYKAFDPDNRGDLSCYAYPFLDSWSRQYDLSIFELRRKAQLAKQAKAGKNLSPLEQLLLSAALYSSFGLSVYDLSRELGVSERSVIRYLTPLKEKGRLSEKTLGKAVYYSLKLQ